MNQSGILFVLKQAQDKTEKERKKQTEKFAIYAHDALNIADPRSMQDACHKLTPGLAQRRVSGDSVVEHWSQESEGLKFS